MGHYHIRIASLAYPGKQTLLSNIDCMIAHHEVTLIAGENGCGKTTLLRLLKPQLHPLMDLDGDIFWEEEQKQSVQMLDEIDSASWIGYVAQDPESQLVSDEVWHELAFGLENIGMKSEQIHQRIAETVTFFGMESWYHTSISTLSGGQKQLLNLASILCMRPKVILLDEPTSQLDPIARQQFLDLLFRIHEEYGIGIIMVEHAMESLLAKCDQVLYFEEGQLVYHGSPAKLCTCPLRQEALLPYPARWCKQHGYDQNPRTIKEMMNLPITCLPQQEPQTKGSVIAHLQHVYFRYQRDGKEILKDLSFQLYQHEIFCLFGGNGSGKTTLFKLLGSKHTAAFGDISLKKRILYLPQDPRILFIKDSLREEFAPYLASQKELLASLGIDALLDCHPYDLSGGELQRAALAYVLTQVSQEVILLLDEPTKGLDMACKESLAKLFQSLSKQHTIWMVSHDIEFAALCATRCGYLFDGDMTSIMDTKEFFRHQYFYTTYWYRVTRNFQTPAFCYAEVSS